MNMIGSITPSHYFESATEKHYNEIVSVQVDYWFFISISSVGTQVYSYRCYNRSE